MSLSALQQHLILAGFIRQKNDVFRSKIGGEWFAIKFNQTTITLMSKRGKSLVYANPNLITVKTLGEIIERSMV